MDTKVSLKQALKSLGFEGGSKQDTELNQWINHEKEVLAEITLQHGIEQEQKGTYEEHTVQQDIQEQKALEEKRQMEQMPTGSIHERLAWGTRKSEMENQQHKKNKTKNRGMEL